MNQIKYIIAYLSFLLLAVLSLALGGDQRDNIHQVNVLHSFGNNVNFTDGTITNALRSLSSPNLKVEFILQPGLWEICADITIPDNVTLTIPSGTILHINDGLSLTINGSVKAGYYQIFSGKGVVKFGNQTESVFPQWWKSNDHKYYNDAIQMALECGARTVFLPADIYDISISDSKNYALKMYSNTSIKGENRKSILRLSEVPQTKGVWDASDLIVRSTSQRFG
jgi:hypothetical protein